MKQQTQTIPNPVATTTEKTLTPDIVISDSSLIIRPDFVTRCETTIGQSLWGDRAFRLGRHKRCSCRNRIELMHFNHRS